MHLILARHSISQQNNNHLISGGSSNPDLSETGIKLAQEKSRFIDENKIDLVYASPLKRAYETAEILTNYHKEIITDKRLVEMKFGDWEGKSSLPLSKKYPVAFDFEGLFSDKIIDCDPHAESYDHLVKRCSSFLNQLKTQARGKTVMIVCHGFTIRGLLSSLFNLQPKFFGESKNVSFTEIDFDEENEFQPRLLSFNREKPTVFAVK